MCLFATAAESAQDLIETTMRGAGWKFVKAVVLQEVVSLGYCVDLERLKVLRDQVGRQQIMAMHGTPGQAC
jgi:hypothetical protein